MFYYSCVVYYAWMKLLCVLFIIRMSHVRFSRQQMNDAAESQQSSLPSFSVFYKIRLASVHTFVVLTFFLVKQPCSSESTANMLCIPEIAYRF